jgi:TPR repeat protein
VLEGASYLTGDFLPPNVPKDAEKGFRILLAAAEKGHARSQYLLSLAYDQGQGTPRDEVESLKWLKKAAERGYKEAVKRLSEIEKTKATNSKNGPRPILGRD